MNRERIATPAFGVAERFKSKLPHLKNPVAKSITYKWVKEGLEASPGMAKFGYFNRLRGLLPHLA